MRRIAMVVLAGAVLAVPQAAAKGGPPRQLLGFVVQGKSVAVAKLDALTLTPVSRTASTGTSDASLVSRGGWIAVATASASLRFLDARTMRWSFRVPYPGRPAAAVWSFANKLVTLNQSSTAEVIVVDPEHRRLSTFRQLRGSLVASVVLRDRIVALLAPIDGIGAAKLAVIDDGGRVRESPLPRVRAGSSIRNNGETATFEYPALAANETTAVVISADGTVVDITLDTLAATSHALSRALASVRKQATGSTRTARFVDPNVIALTGADASFDGTTQRAAPAGLTLVDTRDWSTRRVDTQTTGVASSRFGPSCSVCDSYVIAYGSNGLAAYDSDGPLRFRLFAGTQVAKPVVASGYTYLGSGTRFSIIDTETGAIVRTLTTAVPTYLTESWSY